jgi:hypothetical protein
LGGQINTTTGTGSPAGLSLTWLQYGGPAKVTFETTGPILVTNGRVQTTANFTQPGTYELIALANDRAMTTRLPITITVQ